MRTSDYLLHSVSRFQNNSYSVHVSANRNIQASTCHRLCAILTFGVWSRSYYILTMSISQREEERSGWRVGWFFKKTYLKKKKKPNQLVLTEEAKKRESSSKRLDVEPDL